MELLLGDGAVFVELLELLLEEVLFLVELGLFGFEEVLGQEFVVKLGL